MTFIQESEERIAFDLLSEKAMHSIGIMKFLYPEYKCSYALNPKAERVIVALIQEGLTGKEVTDIIIRLEG